MSQKKKVDTLALLIRILGTLGFICALTGAVSGITMLLLRWAGQPAPNILTQLAMILLPLAVLLMAASLLVAVIRRKNPTPC